VPVEDFNAMVYTDELDLFPAQSSAGGPAFLSQLATGIFNPSRSTKPRNRRDIPILGYRPSSFVRPEIADNLG
jgi:hypothetical protein